MFDKVLQNIFYKFSIENVITSVYFLKWRSYEIDQVYGSKNCYLLLLKYVSSLADKIRIK